MVRKAAHNFVIGFIDMTDDFCGKCLILPLMPKSLLDEMEYEPYNTHRTKAVVHMLLKGAAHMHSQGIIHRDLKPSNILVNHISIYK